jgi:hypothetical protein
MTVKSGLAGSVGFGDEAVWGTAVAPTVHVPLVEESITEEIARLESDGIISGARVRRSQQWEPGTVTASGDIGLELNDQSKGLLLKHMFGGASTAGPFSPADLTGLGLSVQVGVPDVDTGTVRPKTLAGGKVASWEIGLTAGEIATLGLSVIGRHVVGHRSVADAATTTGSATVTSATIGFSANDVGKPVSGTGIPVGTTIASVASATSATMSANATATASNVTVTVGLALTSPSYASSIAPMSFVGGSVTIAGAAFKVRELTLAGDNGLADDRVFVGQRTVDEPLEADLRAYTGTIETEYWSDTAYRRFLDGTETALVATIARGSKSVQVTCNARFDGETPQVGGRGVVGQTLPFTCVGSTTDASAITVTLDET